MIKINTLYSLGNISDCYCVLSNGEIVNQTTGHIKSKTVGKRGYQYVTLNEKNTNRQIKVPVHKIVALAFINNDSYEDINHIDGNKLNNSVGNLEFCTQKENVIHAWKSGLINRQEKRFVAEFSDYKIVGTMKEISRKTDIPRNTLYDLVYKNKGSKKHNIRSIIEALSNEGQETIQR